MSQYRQSADPRTVEVLFSLAVSTAKGRELVGAIGALSIVFWVALAVSIFMGMPPEIEPYFWTMPVGGIVFGVLALVIHRRRRRALVIRRIGEDIELAIDQEAVHVLFPITCHGTQMTIHVKGAPMYEIYLQLVSENQRGITLHETRGTIHGPERDWFPSDIDRSVASPVFDVAGAGTLRKILDRVEVFSRERT